MGNLQVTSYISRLQLQAARDAQIREEVAGAKRRLYCEVRVQLILKLQYIVNIYV